MNILNILPEELTKIIYKKYFNQYVIPDIKNLKCRNIIYTDEMKTKYKKCNIKCYDSIYCLHCYFNFTSDTIPKPISPRLAPYHICRFLKENNYKYY